MEVELEHLARQLVIEVDPANFRIDMRDFADVSLLGLDLHPHLKRLTFRLEYPLELSVEVLWVDLVLSRYVNDELDHVTHALYDYE